MGGLWHIRSEGAEEHYDTPRGHNCCSNEKLRRIFLQTTKINDFKH